MFKTKQRIILFFKNEYQKTLLENEKEKKPSISQAAGKMLILFFITILVFTVVSRAADSITVAQITVSNPQKGSLNYSVSGDGTIKSADEVYMNIIAGYRIDKLKILQGQKIEKGDTLFLYNTEELQNKYDSIVIEIKKLKLQIQQAKLNGTATSPSKKNSSTLSLKQAKENLEKAKLNLKEAKEEYKENSEKTKEEGLKDTKDKYKEAVKNYESSTYTKEKELAISLRILEDAKTALSQANDNINEIERLIEAYKAAVLSKDVLRIYNSKQSLYAAYYSSSNAYSEHKNDLSIAEVGVSRATEDLNAVEEEKQTVLIKYYNAMNASIIALETAKVSSDKGINSEANIKVLTAEYDTASNNYLNKQTEYKAKIKLLERTLEDTKSALNKIKIPDNKIEEYITIYQVSLEGTGNTTTAGENLSYLLMGDNAKTIMSGVASKTLALTRAEEDYETLKEETERILKDLQEKIVTLEGTLENMEDGTYNYAESLETKKQAVEAAKEAVRIAKQSVDTNEIQYESDKESDTATVASNQKSAKNADLINQGYYMDIEVKEKEIVSIGRLLKCSGEVKAPYSGTVTSVGIEAGKTTTGDELIKIGLGDYIFSAEFNKESANYVKAGNEIAITIKGEKNGIEAEVKAVSINVSGMAELTAILPKDDYLIGESASFKVTNISDKFDLCVPIQAIRKDIKGYFVLVTREQEGILGTELVAFRIDVEILEKDSAMAAVNGALNWDDNVMIGSSKTVEAADRVRLKH